MTDPNKDTSRDREPLDRLIARLLHGEASSEDDALLADALQSDPAAFATLEAQLQVDALLWQAAEPDSHVFAESVAARLACENDAAFVERVRGRLPDEKHSVIRWWPAAVAGLAVSIALAFALWPRAAAEHELTTSGVAVLSQTLDAEFQGPDLQVDATISPGTIKLTLGLAQIEFYSGATVLVEGEAEIEVISAWEARCHRGRVRVHVPPAAKGFLMHAPEMKLEDLGTEFALNVDPTGRESAVHVFDGEIIVHTDDAAPANLRQGMSLSSTGVRVQPPDFLAVSELQGFIRQREQRRFEQWNAWSKEARRDSRLIAYYTFKHWPDDRWDRLVNNFAEPRQKQRAGGAVGATWTQGRWPGKEALEFKRPGDRVRMNLDGTYAALTFACWVKVNSVDKKYNSLLLTDGYESGEPHWQIYEDGSLMFSIGYANASELRVTTKTNQIYYSKPVFTSDNLGRWHHLAVTYDNAAGTVVQYFDGREAGREVSGLHQPGRDVVLGPCEIGNWGLPTQGHQFAIRNLNGAIDEFAIYSEALSAAEVRTIFEQGKPE